MNAQRRSSRSCRGSGGGSNKYIIASSCCSSILNMISAKREHQRGRSNLGGRKAEGDAARSEGAVARGSIELVTDDDASQWKVK
jgi:hypothetical protein